MLFYCKMYLIIYLALSYFAGKYDNFVIFYDNSYEDCLEYIEKQLNIYDSTVSKYKVDVNDVSTFTQGFNDINGNPTGIIGLINDITELINAYNIKFTTYDKDYPIILFYYKSVNDYYNVNPLLKVYGELSGVGVNPGDENFELTSIYLQIFYYISLANSFESYDLYKYIGTVTREEYPLLIGSDNINVKILPDNSLSLSIDIYMNGVIEEKIKIPLSYIYEYGVGQVKQDDICHILYSNNNRELNPTYLILLTYSIGMLKELDKGILYGYLAAIEEINLDVYNNII